MNDGTSDFQGMNNNIMQSLSPTSRYLRAPQRRGNPSASDDVQKEAVDRLENFIRRHREKSSATPPGGDRIARLGKLYRAKPMGRAKCRFAGCVYGARGRGKKHGSWTFHTACRASEKLRLHFHRFMLRVHEELPRYSGRQTIR